MEIIHKDAGDLKLAPNFTDYEQTRASFSWAEVPELCAGMGEGGCNIAYAAVDRHAAGPEAARTAMLFSRINTVLSVPMLLCMVGQMHFG